MKSTTWICRRAIAVSARGAAAMLFAMPLISLSAPSESPKPILKQGLWEITSSDTLNPKIIVFQQICAGTIAQETAFENKVYEKLQKHCTVSAPKRELNKITFTATCNDGYAPRLVNIVFSGDFASKFEQKSKEITAAPAPTNAPTETKYFKFVGMCPNNMTAGDMAISRDGKKTFNKWNGYESQGREYATPVQ